MAKIPKAPEDIFEEFTADFQNAYGEDLQAIILYGSGAVGQYIHKKSDINFLIVLTEDGIEQLHKALDLIPKWRKRNVAVPLFLTKLYIDSALDTYPIEFLNMKNSYRVVFGQDVLKDLDIKEGDLRLQIERELRGKLIHLREGFLSTAHDRKQLQELLSSSVPTFSSIFSALLYLKHERAPEGKEAVFAKTAETFGLEGRVFQDLMAIRTGRWKGSKERLRECAQDYIREIKKLVQLVDQM